MRTRTIGHVALAIALSALDLEAQQDTVAARAARRVVGTVATSSGTPLPGAEIAVIERDSTVRRARSDSAGRFQVDAPSPEVRLRVRRVGFHQREVTVRVANGEREASVFVTLEPTAANLDTVLVDDVADPESRDPRLIAFRERAATNSFGHYVTEEMIARLRPNHASDALRSISGVLVRSAGPTRVGNIVRLRGCGARDQRPERTGPLVWVDGVRLPGAELDEVASGPDVAAIEVYNSFAGVPPQYLDRTAVCGTILVWTKVR